MQLADAFYDDVSIIWSTHSDAARKLEEENRKPIAEMQISEVF